MNFTYRSTPGSLIKRPTSKAPSKNNVLSFYEAITASYITFPRPKVNFELNFSRHFVLGFSKCHVIKNLEILYHVTQPLPGPSPDDPPF